MAGLEHVECASHVPLREFQQRLPAFFRYLHAGDEINDYLFHPRTEKDSLFSFDHIAKLLLHLRDWVGGEPEACAPALHRRRDFVDVVAYDAEPDIFGVLFYHTT